MYLYTTVGCQQTLRTLRRLDLSFVRLSISTQIPRSYGTPFGQILDLFTRVQISYVSVAGLIRRKSIFVVYIVVTSVRPTGTDLWQTRTSIFVNHSVTILQVYPDSQTRGSQTMPLCLWCPSLWAFTYLGAPLPAFSTAATLHAGVKRIDLIVFNLFKFLYYPRRSKQPRWYRRTPCSVFSWIISRSSFSIILSAAATFFLSMLLLVRRLRSTFI